MDHGNILEINNVAFAPLKVEWPAEKNESYVLSMTGMLFFSILTQFVSL